MKIHQFKPLNPSRSRKLILHPSGWLFIIFSLFVFLFFVLRCVQRVGETVSYHHGFMIRLSPASLFKDHFVNQYYDDYDHDFLAIMPPASTTPSYSVKSHFLKKITTHSIHLSTSNSIYTHYYQHSINWSRIKYVLLSTKFKFKENIIQEKRLLLLWRLGTDAQRRFIQVEVNC